MKDNFDLKQQQNLAKNFHALHYKDTPLILANAWDAMSAKIVELGDLPAVATTSSGISWSCGYADGEHTPPDMMIEEIRKMTRAVNIPVSADIEGGYYGNDLDALSLFIEKVIKSGAVGVNLEDSDAKTGALISIEDNTDKIKATRQKAEELEIDLYINARVDGMTLSADLNKKLEVIFERAEAYKAAGASGIFVPFVQNIEIVKKLKENIDLPLNILMAKSLDVETIKALKINRISVGGRPSLIAKTYFRHIVENLRNGNNWEDLFAEGITHPEANKWFL